ncbi:hypothetical protein KHA93_19415 [Bacillus sp. FJAT-49732]|uniref:Uncharacterized protein n=1 Tax=Lederbergia citrisecunda TaxID=2833583 RepID=A0A942TNW3_9BACI|nr:hypothetical protein [Lederbergia citrisecunda]MBS4201776.1 hypothetical protein [Lederbergia citrisecunda]
MVDKYLASYISIGGIVGLFFGGMWEGISAMVLIYIAQRLEYITRIYEKRND